MKALAEFILRGRLQALVVTLIGSFFPLISSAAIALVSLCKGVKDGTLLFLWASLALVLVQRAGAENSLLTAVSISSLGMMVFTASVHRVLASWQWTLLATVLVAVICAQGFGLFMGSSVTALVATAQEMLNAVTIEEQTRSSVSLSESMVLGLIATILAVGSVMSLMLARWWQAGIKNPGGFQKEFHSFSIDANIALMLILVLIAGQFFSKNTQIWADLAALPLLIAGIALFHYVVKLFNLGKQWLAFLYAGIIMLGKPVTLILVVLGLTDSLIDLRSKLEGYKKPKV